MLRLLLLVGLWNTPAATGDADALYRRGNEAATAERWDEALSLWAQAEALDPRWKYAFNQATVLAFLGRLAEAWAACERARRHGVPPDHAAEVDAEQRRVEEGLLADHALVELTVAPADATVTLDGTPLPAPHRALLRRAASRLVVARAGHATLDETWAHPIGARTTRAVHLAPSPPTAPEAPAALTLTAPSDGAPTAGHRDDAATDPFASAPGLDAPAASGPHPAWKWVAFGVGAAAGAAGGVLLADAEANRRPEVFRRDAAAAESTYTDSRDPGLALAAAGGAAVLTGVVLWLLEDAP